MMGRRFGPLIVLLSVGLGVVLWRVWTIQVGEHTTWAREAANLERSSRRLPYHRGTIRARGDQVLVEDEERYRVSFEWRAFRRENPIGQVALARAAKTGAGVELSRDPEKLCAQALELLELSPRGIADLVEGGLEQARDLGFYLRRILALEGGADRRLLRLMEEREEERSVLSLSVIACADARTSLRGEEAIARHVSERCRAALDDLAQLERSLRREPGSLWSALESFGEDVDDAVASRMFRRATGFSAGRLAPEDLAEWDLVWLVDALHWGEERASVWRRRAREGWQAHMLSRVAACAALEARLEGSETSFEGLLPLVAASMSPLDGAGSTVLEPWMGAESAQRVAALFECEVQPLVADELPLFIACAGAVEGYGDELGARLLEEHAGPVELGDWAGAWMEAGRSEWGPPASLKEARSRWRREGTQLAQWLVVVWAREWEAGWSRYMDALTAGGSWRLGAERVESALDDRDYYLVEQGRRSRAIAEDPSYEVIYLLTRYPGRFRGFQVETRTRRRTSERLLAGGDPLWRVIGSARKTNLEEMLVHREGFEVFRDLRQLASRSSTDEVALRELAERLPRYDELHGAEGVERLMDVRLSGRNGYLEYEGLSDIARRGTALAVEWRPQHGEDVSLTIDLALQHAASETINNPDPTNDPRYSDDAWFAAPTGAICLITPDGEVLAAASAPNILGRDAIPHRDGQGAFAHERTLRRHTALPIGSIFKPFVALWCLENGLVTGDEALSCVHRMRRGANVPGYSTVDCHSSVGHGKLKLAGALRVSCNAYFAQLGDRLQSAENLIACAETFGFNQPTGVNAGFSGSAIAEDYANPAFRQGGQSIGRSELQRGANGLTVLEGTPLQVARAFAGLATGSLPSLSFVAVAGEGASEPLKISDRHLAAVRAALIDVVQRGSAKHLRGLDVAAKTGSADYRPMSPLVRAQLDYPAGARLKMRKHTWVAGWAPARNPRLIFVVYLHDVGVTSTHSAVFVARQLLERPAVQAYLAEGG